MGKMMMFSLFISAAAARHSAVNWQPLLLAYIIYNHLLEAWHSLLSGVCYSLKQLTSKMRKRRTDTWMALRCITWVHLYQIQSNNLNLHFKVVESFTLWKKISWQCNQQIFYTDVFAMKIMHWPKDLAEFCRSEQKFFLYTDPVNPQLLFDSRLQYVSHDVPHLNPRWHEISVREFNGFGLKIYWNSWIPRLISNSVEFMQQYSNFDWAVEH